MQTAQHAGSAIPIATLRHVQPPLGFLFAGMITLAFVNMLSFLTVFAGEKPTLQQARWRGRAGAVAWANALLDVQSLLVVAQIAIFAPLAYFAGRYDANAEKFAIFFLAHAVGVCCMCYLGARLRSLFVLPLTAFVRMADY